eukprot:9882597-Lingulodinium_polyedra.AAC.1
MRGSKTGLRVESASVRFTSRSGQRSVDSIASLRSVSPHLHIDAVESTFRCRSGSRSARLRTLCVD